MLTTSQLHLLTNYLRLGAADASIALSRWIGRNALISVERVEQLGLQDATSVLGVSEEPVAACIMTMNGHLTGQLIMLFDDASGLALTDILTEQPVGTAKIWGELERSAALETANIIGCAYLNAISRLLRDGHSSHEILPSPPKFHQDYAQSLLQFALMDQAMASDTVFLTETQFSIENSPANWVLMFVPDAESLPHLESILKTK
jgi:chemotaxis protein CheC